MNVSNLLSRSAHFFPERPAVCEDGVETSYSSLNSMANRIATGLIKMGIRPGDLVGICAPNTLDWIAFYYGTLKAGAVAITFSYGLQAGELELLLTHARPRMVFTNTDRFELVQNLADIAGLEKVICESGDTSLSSLMAMGTDRFTCVDRNRSDTAAVLYTGGTSGTPKGVMLSHENILTSSYNVAYSERSTETDRSLCFLPLNHVFGQIHILGATIFSSGCVELLPSYDMEKVLSITCSGRVTKLYAVPTIYTRMLNVDDLRNKLGRVRYCFSAAASMAAEIVRKWKSQTGLTIYEGYGLTESAAAVTYNNYYEHVTGSVGTTVPGVEIEIRSSDGYPQNPNEEGEICIRGRNIMNGYLNNPEATDKAFWDDGWFRSGDIGIIDKRGYLFIVDRLKDMIITGGENVYPREVEEVLFTAPEVQECAVVGLPDKDWGEKVTAFIVLQKDRKIDVGELKAFLKERISAFKVPKTFLIVDELPKNTTGKILKREIRKQYVDVADS